MARVRRHHSPSPAPRKSGGSGVFAFLLMFLLLGGGGYGFYVYQNNQKAQQAAAQKAKEEARRKAAAEKAERERLAAEAAERARQAAAEEEEQRRREAEEAERARREAEEEEERRRREQETTDDTTPEPEPEPKDDEPEPTPDVPQEAGPYDAPLVISGTEGISRTSQETYDGMIRHLLAAHDFDAFARAFEKRIADEAPLVVKGEKLAYNTYKSSRNMVQAVDICLLTRLCGQQELAGLAATAGEADSGQAFFAWLLTDRSRPLHSLLQNYVLQEGRPENLPYTLKTFYAIWKACPPKEREKYLNLAMACAMVRPQVAQGNGMLRNPKPNSLLDPVQVFTYFREADAKHKLLTDIKKMSVERLLHVVDFRLPQSEIDWVHQNLSYSRDKWGDAYGSIRYRMDRAANGKDPYTKYTFAELRKEGGVCRDQAYFCGTSAKCKGIPAIYVVGDGDRGGHAWVVLSVADNQWSQINNYGYTTGRFPNPCSGRQHHESVFLGQTKVERAAKLEPAADGILLSRLLSQVGSAEEARGAARYVAAAFPTLTVAWENLIAALENEKGSPTGTNEWRKAYNEMSRAAAKNGELLELAGKVQDKHLMDGKTAGAQKSALDSTVRRLKHNMGDARADLVVETVERQAKLLADNKDFRGLMNLYKKQLKDYSARGDIFQQLLDSYMRHLNDMEAPPAEWGRTAKEVDRLFSKGVLSGSGDYFKLSKEVTIQRMVADCYAKAGNTKKAEKMIEEAETRLRNAKSQYQGQ